MSFRPAAAVARDLTNLARFDGKPVSAKKLKTPKPIDLYGVRVLTVEEHGRVTVLRLALTESDLVLVNVGCDDAMKGTDKSYTGEIAKPVISTEAGPALILRVDVGHAGIVVGSILNVRVRFSVDTAFPVPVVEAVSASLTVRKFARPVATITLPAITVGTVRDVDVGLPENDAAQIAAERFLTAAIAYRNRRAA